MDIMPSLCAVAKQLRQNSITGNTLYEDKLDELLSVELPENQKIKEAAKEQFDLFKNALPFTGALAVGCVSLAIFMPAALTITAAAVTSVALLIIGFGYKISQKFLEFINDDKRVKAFYKDVVMNCKSEGQLPVLINHRINIHAFLPERLATS